MAEEKPFDATPARRSRARRDGDVARSQALLGTIAFACAWLAYRAATATLVDDATLAFVGARKLPLAEYAAMGATIAALALAGPAGSVLAAVATGGAIVLRTPALNFQRCNPSEGLKRMFSREAFVAGARGTLAFGAAGVLGGVGVSRAVAAAAHGAAPAATAAIVAGVLDALVAATIATGLVFSIADAGVERARWLRRLRMTFAEIKRESREHDGDPHQRARRRQTHRSLVRGSIARLREAAFVVTNPTHVAVALAYRPPDIDVPRVVVRAVDSGAQLVKDKARELGVPIVENVALARALLATSAIDEPISPELYVAVAELVVALEREPTLAR